MLTEETIKKIAFHKQLHDVGMCTCPCLDAVLTMAAAIKKEEALRHKMAIASPDAFTALMLGHYMNLEVEDGVDKVEGARVEADSSAS